MYRYRFPEDPLLARIAAALPNAGYDGRAQFAQMLPLAAIFSGILTLGFVGLGGLSFALAAIQLGSPIAIVKAILLLAPPILWIGSFFLLQKKRRLGWRMFAIACLLAFVQALLTFQVFSLLFDALFLYAAIQSYDAYRY